MLQESSKETRTFPLTVFSLFHGICAVSPLMLLFDRIDELWYVKEECNLERHVKVILTSFYIQYIHIKGFRNLSGFNLKEIHNGIICKYFLPVFHRLDKVILQRITEREPLSR